MGRRDDDGYASFDGDEDSGAASYSESSSASGGGLSPEVLARAGGSSSSSSGSGRRHSRGGMASKASHSSGSHGHRGKSRGGFRLDTGSLREAAGSMLTVAVAGIVVCAIILYFTFVQATIPQFYGALGASMVVMFLLCFVAARLLGAHD